MRVDEEHVEFVYLFNSMQVEWLDARVLDIFSRG